MGKMDNPIDREYNRTYLPESDYINNFADPLWTVEDVAAYLKLQPETIRSMARRRELPGLKIGKVWRFQKHAIRKMLINLD
jgi:excisionase family DNA binding protein